MLVIIGVIIAAMFCTGGLGFVIERVAYKPLRNKARLTALITAIGMSLFLENFPRALPFIGPNAKSFPSIIPVKMFQIGNLTVTSVQLVMIGVTLVLCLVMNFFVQRTTYGKQMRAVCQDKNAASLMGINVNGVISLTFFIGCGAGCAQPLPVFLPVPHNHPDHGQHHGAEILYLRRVRRDWGYPRRHAGRPCDGHY